MKNNDGYKFPISGYIFIAAIIIGLFILFKTVNITEILKGFFFAWIFGGTIYTLVKGILRVATLKRREILLGVLIVVFALLTIIIEWKFHLYKKVYSMPLIIAMFAQILLFLPLIPALGITEKFEYGEKLYEQAEELGFNRL